MPDAASVPTLAEAASALEAAVSRLEDVAEALALRAEEQAANPPDAEAAATMAEAAQRLDAVIARLAAVLEQE